ncbi:hypothetical protein K7X08_011197 [Anisodus acutangulus]|uniref:Uncharacterized protein n=1 Tax=Anisodus acutangulus TaxID=402998 RepID=A0A9Q1RAW9_9SOLA|nr:hypothetical protein K7X08_011197 [Anisodus acutangulus]
MTRILRWKTEEKFEPVDPFRNVTERAVVRHFLYPDHTEKSNKYIKDLVDYDDEVPDLNINFLKREIGPVERGFGRHCNLPMLRRPKVMSTSVTFKLVSRNCYCLLSIYVLFTYVNFEPMNVLDCSPLSHPDHVDDAHCGPSSPLPDEVVDVSCNTLPFIDYVHVHNDDDPSSPLPDQVEDASCNTLPSSPLPVQVDDARCKILSGKVADSVVDSKDRSPDERIIDVLAQIHGEDAIEEFGDAAQNGYETGNEKVF